MENTDNTEQENTAAQYDDDNCAQNLESEEQPEEKVDEIRILEALLFASEEQLTPAKLKALLPEAPDLRRIRAMVKELNEKLKTEGHPFEIAEIGGAFQFRTLSLYYPWVKKLYKERAAKKLSVAALECLAIIAYRQPISKAEIEAVRGVMSDGSMKTLLEKRLIDFTRDDNRPGRPLLYSTTNEFLKYFGINKITDLPRIEEFEAMARDKMEELSTEELSLEEANSNNGDNENDDNQESQQQDNQQEQTSETAAQENIINLNDGEADVSSVPGDNNEQ